MDERAGSGFRDVRGDEFDTDSLLRNAARQRDERGFDDFLIIDVDSHHYETEAFREIADYIRDPVLRHEARYQGAGSGGIISELGSYQSMTGRVTRYPGRRKEKVPPTPHRDITLMQRWMNAMGVDIACMFPTPMLNLASCARVDVQVGLATAYNHWLCDKILAEDPRIKSMLYLPLHDPLACLEIVLEFADKPGVIGFMITAPHYASIYNNDYAKVYSTLQERGLPLAFHAGFPSGDAGLKLTNRFISLHALGFPWFNMIHLTNWIINGMPERFPRLNTIWIESGLAWIPFLMQRLDNEFMMRSSDAPMLKRLPSDYMRDMFFSSQPMERVKNAKALEVTFEMIDAPKRLLYSSDYPHWDMDLPSTIYDLPFLSEVEKRNILGENARKLFGLDATPSTAKLERRKFGAAKTFRS